MDDAPDQVPAGQVETLSLILKAIRQRRGLSSADTARSMKMAHRTYQHFEAGDLGVDIPKVHRFAEAEAVHADAWGIIFAIEFGSVDFALHCADNQASKALLSSLRRFNLRAGKDLARLDTRSLFIVFSKAFDEISARAREYDADLEPWMFDATLNGEPDPPDTPKPHDDDEPDEGQT